MRSKLRAFCKTPGCLGQARRGRATTGGLLSPRLGFPRNPPSTHRSTRASAPPHTPCHSPSCSKAASVPPARQDRSADLKVEGNGREWSRTIGSYQSYRRNTRQRRSRVLAPPTWHTTTGPHAVSHLFNHHRRISPGRHTGASRLVNWHASPSGGLHTTS